MLIKNVLFPVVVVVYDDVVVVVVVALKRNGMRILLKFAEA